MRYGKAIIGLAFGLLVVLAGCEGPTGPPGRDAGVLSFEVDFFVDEAAVNGAVASAQYDVAALSPAVVAEGAVLAFFREQDTWTALPFTYGVESEDVPAVDYTVTLGYAYEAGLLEVFYELSLADEDLLRSLPDQRLKVVVIANPPPRPSAVNLSSYESVRRYFGLEEQ